MTAQFLERLHHGGETVGMVADPLAVYFEMGGRNRAGHTMTKGIYLMRGEVQLLVPPMAARRPRQA